MFYNKIQNITSCVHNLSNVKIPKAVEICFFLGFKFNFNVQPNFLQIQASIQEGIRKYAWKVFFLNKGESVKMDELTQVAVKIKKSVSNAKVTCPLEHVLFGENFAKNCSNSLKRVNNKVNKLHLYLLAQLTNFLQSNDLVVRQSDKNAGIVVMNKVDYDNEIMRQLTDLHTYTPSTQAHFDYAMHKFNDDIRYFSKIQFSSFKISLKSLIPKESQPSKFYILPKLHKKFDQFPIGRPICSNLNTINRGIAILLDAILKPLTVHINNLLIDTPHLLTLLHNIQLDPTKTYCLVAADIQAMYQELPINICKRNCILFYNKYKDQTQFPFEITETQLKRLLDFSLDYSFLQFGNEIFLQNRGIQMGNNSSVSIANLTAAVELEALWRNEMIFNRRFIDDIFLIVDITEITDISLWLHNTFTHDFLKFTFEFSVKIVNFLDLSISLTEANDIVTTLYSKPMSKHEYLFYESNHPSHMIKSLPYSCGIRIIRVCSEEQDRIRNLEIMFNKFLRRNYPVNLLNDTKDKLLQLNRLEIITPKSTFHKKHISLHNPEIILDSSVNDSHESNCYIYFVLPFYKIHRMKGEVYNKILSSLHNCKSKRLREIAMSLTINFAFTIPDQIHKKVSAIETKK